MTEEQKQNMVGILRLGCERWTAAKFAGVMRDELEKALAADEAFALELGKAEAVAELKHMKVVHEAAQDPKNWRSSAWWLEQRTRQREGGDDPTLAHVMELVDALSEIIMAEIKDDALQKRVIERLKEIVYGKEMTNDQAPMTKGGNAQAPRIEVEADEVPMIEGAPVT